MLKPHVLVAIAFASLLACVDDAKPAETPAGATIAVAPAAASAAASSPATYVINAQNSKIEWTGTKTSTHHDGAFTSFTGQVDFAGTVEGSKVLVDIDTGSLTVNDPALGPMVDKLTGHLKSPDFFNIGQFPKASFASTSIAKADAGYTVSGTLTIRGIAKQVTFPANITGAGDKVSADATFTINRKDFGMTLLGKPDDPIKDDVAVRLAIHADKKS